MDSKDHSLFGIRLLGYIHILYSEYRDVAMQLPYTWNLRKKLQPVSPPEMNLTDVHFEKFLVAHGTS